MVNVVAHSAQSGPHGGAALTDKTSEKKLSADAKESSRVFMSARDQAGDQLVHGVGEAEEHRKIDPIDRDEYADTSAWRENDIAHEPRAATALLQESRLNPLCCYKHPAESEPLHRRCLVEADGDRYGLTWTVDRMAQGQQAVRIGKIVMQPARHVVGRAVKAAAALGRARVSAW